MRLILIFILCIMLVGCVTPEKITDIVKQTEEGKKFLEQYPNAEIKAVKLSEGLVNKTINAINKNCDSEIDIKPYWKVTFYDHDLDKGIISYVDTESNEPVCIYSYSKNPKCTEIWTCSEWTDCSEEGKQTRTCTDAHSCGIMANKPTEEKTCIPLKKTCQELKGYICGGQGECGTDWLDSSDSYCCPIKCGACEQICDDNDPNSIDECGKKTGYKCINKIKTKKKVEQKEVVTEELEVTISKKENFIPYEDRPNHPQTKKPEPKTQLKGIISTDIIWHEEDSPFLVTGNILIEEGNTLTIEPGVEIRFVGDYYLLVDGTLKAIGTKDKMIIFTTNYILEGMSKKELDDNNYGYWNQIKFSRKSKGAILDESRNYLDGSILSYVKIEYAHNSAIFTELATPLIEHSILSHNRGQKGGGIHSEGSHGVGGAELLDLPLIRFNLIENNTADGGGIYFSGFGNIIGNVIRNNQASVSNGASGLHLRFFVGNSKELYPLLDNNIIENNNGGSAGILIQGTVNMSKNTIIKNKPIGILAYEVGRQYTIHFNNIYLNGEYDLKRVDASEIPIYAENNYWGTIDESQIQNRIYDFYDDFRLEKVIFNPFLRVDINQ